MNKIKKFFNKIKAEVYGAFGRAQAALPEAEVSPQPVADPPPVAESCLDVKPKAAKKAPVKKAAATGNKPGRPKGTGAKPSA